MCHHSSVQSSTTACLCAAARCFQGHMRKFSKSVAFALDSIFYSGALGGQCPHVHVHTCKLLQANRHVPHNTQTPSSTSRSSHSSSPLFEIYVPHRVTLAHGAPPCSALQNSTQAITSLRFHCRPTPKHLTSAELSASMSTCGCAHSRLTLWRSSTAGSVRCRARCRDRCRCGTVARRCTRRLRAASGPARRLRPL